MYTRGKVVLSRVIVSLQAKEWCWYTYSYKRWMMLVAIIVDTQTHQAKIYFGNSDNPITVAKICLNYFWSELNTVVSWSMLLGFAFKSHLMCLYIGIWIYRYRYTHTHRINMSDYLSGYDYCTACPKPLNHTCIMNHCV